MEQDVAITLCDRCKGELRIGFDMEANVYGVCKKCQTAHPLPVLELSFLVSMAEKLLKRQQN